MNGIFPLQQNQHLSLNPQKHINFGEEDLLTEELSKQMRNRSQSTIIPQHYH